MDIHQLELFGGGSAPRGESQAAGKCFVDRGAGRLPLRKSWDELHTERFVGSGKRLIRTPAEMRLVEHAKELIKRMGQIKQEF